MIEWNKIQLDDRSLKGEKFELNPLTPLEWLASNFSLQYHPWITYLGHENNGNDQKLQKLWIVKLILPVSTSGNVSRTVWRIWIVMLGCKAMLNLWWYRVQVIYFIQSKRELMCLPRFVPSLAVLWISFYPVLINIVKFYQSFLFATMDLNDVSVHKHPNIHYVHGNILSISSYDFALSFVLRKKKRFWPYNKQVVHQYCAQYCHSRSYKSN